MSFLLETGGPTRVADILKSDFIYIHLSKMPEQDGDVCGRWTNQNSDCSSGQGCQFREDLKFEN